jgi:ribosome-associated protein
MGGKKELINSEKLSEIVVDGMKEKKAQNIVVMDLREVKNAIADFFVICTGTSETQIEAISESVEEFVYKFANQGVWHKEGKENKEWILLDFVDVVVNVFKKSTREFYSLEQLWGDAKLIIVETVN